MEGGESVVVGLDTGQGGALAVFGHYARQKGFLEGRPLSESQGGGVGGATVSKTGTLRSVALAGFELHDVPVTFPPEDVKGAFDTKRQAGNLGAGILTRFRVLFDYAHECLWLEPGPGLDAPFPRDRTGLGIPEGRPGSPRRLRRARQSGRSRRLARRDARDRSRRRGHRLRLVATSWPAGRAPPTARPSA